MTISPIQTMSFYKYNSINLQQQQQKSEEKKNLTKKKIKIKI